MKFVTQDYYEILNVSPGATNEEVKRAYRLVRQSFRPDSMAIHSLYAPEETEAISAKIDEAFRILSDPELARRYAKYHRSARPGVDVPRDPDVFFDLVHDLDGPSPIEQLARQVGRLSEVRRKADRVAEEPVPVAVRSLPPEPRFNPSPVSHAELPAVASPPPETPPVVGDPVDTEPARHVLPEAPPPAPPMSVFDEPIVAPASVLIDIDSRDEEEIESISVLAPVSIEEDDEEVVSFDAEDPISELIESLPSSAFLSPLESAPAAAPAPRETAPSVAPVRPHVERGPEPLRPAATSAPDPSLMPLPGAQVAPRSPVRAVAPPAVTAEQPAPPVEPPGPPQPPTEKPTAGALALKRRPTAPRRWERGSVRKRSPGKLEVTPLGKDVLASIEMDAGGMNGSFLQKVRRELDVSVKDISDRTKISVMMLRYIEADDIGELPAKVYLKGYLTQVARLLKLPVNEFVQGYFRANNVP